MQLLQPGMAEGLLRRVDVPKRCLQGALPYQRPNLHRLSMQLWWNERTEWPGRIIPPFVLKPKPLLTDSNISGLETFQHAVNNARNRKYLEDAKTERALRRYAESSHVARMPQEPVSNEDLFEDENSAETGIEDKTSVAS